MFVDVTVERMTVSIEAELASAVREAAEADSQTLSAWLADAARQRLAVRGLAGIIAEWETIHGDFTEDELGAARTHLAP